MHYKRIVVTHPGGPEVLQMIEEELPEPENNQVRVRILTTGVAYADVAVRLGTYSGLDSSKGPISPGYDIVGIVDKVGSGVTSVSIGQRVAALTVTGGYSEYICLPAAELIPIPSDLDPAEAVSLVLNYTTAYQMLYRVAEAKSGSTILVHGAAGGVGTALLQLGAVAQMKMIGTA